MSYQERQLKDLDSFMRDVGDKTQYKRDYIEIVHIIQ